MMNLYRVNSADNLLTAGKPLYINSQHGTGNDFAISGDALITDNADQVHGYIPVRTNSNRKWMDSDNRLEIVIITRSHSKQ